jgi:hypothetical protein
MLRPASPATLQSGTGFGLGDFVHRSLPSASVDEGIDRTEIGASDLKIQDWLTTHFVLGAEQRQCLELVLRLQTGLLSGRRILAVIHLAAAEKDEPLFHVFWSRILNQSGHIALTRFRRVSVKFCQVVGEL